MTDPVQLGPFDVGERLGEGGMGVVDRGEHRSTGMPVAIKVIRGEAGANPYGTRSSNSPSGRASHPASPRLAWTPVVTRVTRGRV